MLNWDKINAKLEKEKIIRWGRRKEIDEAGYRAIQDDDVPF